jgi:hypothetical protein
MTTPKPTDALAAAVRDLLAPIIREAVLDAFAELEPEPRPALIDRAALARELHVSTATVSRLMREGLPFVRVGDAARFELARALTWLQSRAEEPKS